MEDDDEFCDGCMFLECESDGSTMVTFCSKNGGCPNKEMEK